jgi:hypothetical protein
MGSVREQAEANAARDRMLRFAAHGTERWRTGQRARDVAVRHAAEVGASVEELTAATGLSERKVKRILMSRPLV